MAADPADAEPMDADRLARKVRWEGGLLAALEYGIDPARITDEALAAEWAELQAAFDRLEPLMDRIAERLGLNK